ncbi:MAG: NAD(P)H-dependent oxidoreductase [Gammaproteobacteria bacterium]|nr:NAD(P)H-dependent oxidoreductase [Gammaproteobacteria bacterium]
MNVVILNGADRESSLQAALCKEVERRLAKHDDSRNTIRTFHLADLFIENCQGEFDCWVKTPGQCPVHDEGQVIAQAVHDAQLLVFLTPVRFGAYSSQLKKAVDRLIPLLSPFYAIREKLTYHKTRYSAMPSLVGIGLEESPDSNQRQLFEALVQSNALNLNSPAFAATVIGADSLSWKDDIDKVLTAQKPPANPSGSLAQAKLQLKQVSLPQDAAEPFDEPPMVALLQASGRAPGTSTSEAILGYLEPQFAAGDAAVEMFNATSFLHDGKTAEDVARRCAGADILIIASPLYVDGLSYPAVMAMEHILAARLQTGAANPARLVMAINCGSPEPEQTRFALASARDFARQAGYLFAGGIAIAGSDNINGGDLMATGNHTGRLRAALDLGVSELLKGRVLPAQICRSIASSAPLSTLYRLAGNHGWRANAKKYGLNADDLDARPFNETRREDLSHS